MFIHVVQPGDSLYRISLQYSVPMDRIRLANGLNTSNIVPGQALVIPTNIYTIRPGDRLSSIANRAYVPLESLEKANPSINPNRLQPGMKIRIPDVSNYSVTSLGYYTLRNPQLDQALITDFSPYSTYIALFEYHFSNDGSLNTINDLPAIQTAWTRRVAPLMTVTNLTAAGFSSDLTHDMLNNPQASENLIRTIVQVISNRGYAGVNIDFEMILEEDRDLFTRFLSQLKERLKPSGYLLSVALYPVTKENEPFLKGYDYGGIGTVVDLIFVMAYNFHYGTSEPGPVAPINLVREALQYAIERVPRNKLILGLPLYGYNWKVPSSPGTVAPAISNQTAVQLAMEKQAPILYSTEYQSPSFQYYDTQGTKHEVWFEDARSISKKLQLIREIQLEGVGAWQLSFGFPEGPWLLTHFFRIKKR